MKDTASEQEKVQQENEKKRSQSKKSNITPRKIQKKMLQKSSSISFQQRFSKHDNLNEHSVIMNILNYIDPIERKKFNFSRIVKVGQGAYGSIFHLPRSNVVFKQVVIQNQSLDFLQRILTEMKIVNFYKCKRNSKNVIKFKSFLKPKSYSNFSEVYFVFEKMDFPLSVILKRRCLIERYLTERNIKFLMFKLLQGLAEIHDNGILHRDIKPGNIMVNIDGNGNFIEVKIIDFGLSCAEKSSSVHTPYVCSRWYRAIELVEEIPYYGSKVDIWSAGCIFAECILTLKYKKRKSLFVVQNSKEMIEKVSNCVEFGIEDYTNTRFEDRIGLRLLEKMLKYEPGLRISAKKALEDDYFKEMRKIDPFYKCECKHCTFKFNAKDLRTQLEVKNEMFYMVMNPSS